MLRRSVVPGCMDVRLLSEALPVAEERGNVETAAFRADAPPNHLARPHTRRTGALRRAQTCADSAVPATRECAPLWSVMVYERDDSLISWCAAYAHGAVNALPCTTPWLARRRWSWERPWSPADGPVTALSRQCAHRAACARCTPQNVLPRASDCDSATSAAVSLGANPTAPHAPTPQPAPGSSFALLALLRRRRCHIPLVRPTATQRCCDIAATG